MAGVPKVWDTLKAGGQAAIASKPPLIAAVIGELIARRDAALRSGTDTPVFARIFAATMGSLVGGRLKCIISGGGPLSSKTQSWVRCALCKIFIQGYNFPISKAFLQHFVPLNWLFLPGMVLPRLLEPRQRRTWMKSEMGLPEAPLVASKCGWSAYQVFVIQSGKNISARIQST